MSSAENRQTRNNKVAQQVTQPYAKRKGEAAEAQMKK